MRCNGIVKGNIVEFSEKPIASIPFRVIDWQNPIEVELHNQITTKIQAFFIQKDTIILEEVNELFNQLLN